MQFSKYFAFLISLITCNTGLRYLILIINLTEFRITQETCFCEEVFLDRVNLGWGTHSGMCVALFHGLLSYTEYQHQQSSFSACIWLQCDQSPDTLTICLPSYGGPNETGNQSKPSYPSCFLEIYKILRCLKSILFFVKFYPRCFCSMKSKGLNGVLTTTVVGYLQAFFSFQILPLKFVILLSKAPQN